MTQDDFLKSAQSYFSKGEYQKAKEVALKGLIQFPQSPGLNYNLGLIYSMLGDFTQAIVYYQSARQLVPSFELAHMNLGVMYIKIGKFDHAIDVFKNYLKINPQSHAAYFNLGLTYDKKAQLDEALEAFQKSVSINPDNAQAHLKIALIFSSQGFSEASISSFAKVIEIDPNIPMAYAGLGVGYQSLGVLTKAKKYLEKAIEMDPGAPIIAELYSLSRKLCDWKDAKKYSDVIDIKNVSGLNIDTPVAESPFSSIIRTTDKKQQLKVATHWSFFLENTVKLAQKVTFTHTQKRKRNKRLKIGYLSKDIKSHPVAFQITDLFKHHDKNAFEVYLYSYTEPNSNPVHNSIKKSVEHFVDLFGEKHDVIARKIHDDEIDILVDLVGFTGNQRPDIAVYRPAPVQVSYLGFLGTSGSKYIDYIIADEIVIPESDQQYYSEKIVYLPNCYQICSAPPVSNKKYTRKELGLPVKGVVFCSFNRLFKIEKKLFDIWIKILKKVPDSVLWLAPGDKDVKKNLISYAKKHGVDPKRLIFAPKLPIDDHMARVKYADIALDTLTWNGGATTAMMLYAGVPVITLQGDHFMSRMSSSILVNLGMKELITKNLEEYEKLAVKLATNEKKLKAHSSKLTANKVTHSLFDTKLFTKNIEKAYTEIWKNYLNEKYDHIIIG